MKLDNNAPSREELDRRLRYDPETGEFTALIAAGKRKAGDRLGYPDALGYWKLAFKGKWVLAHRLAWFMTYGKWPEGEIDHINGDPGDNRIANLREATRSQNAMNTRRGNGVCWHKGRNKWQALVKAKGKSHYLGHFDDRGEAEAVAAAAIRELHGEFANIAPPPPAKQEDLPL